MARNIKGVEYNAGHPGFALYDEMGESVSIELDRDANGKYFIPVTVASGVVVEIGAITNDGSFVAPHDLTDGLQLTQIVDAGGEVATVTSGKLDVNAAINLPPILTVSGVVSVNNLPSVQPVSQSTTPWVVSGTTNIGNFPATQTVSGAVSVNNFPSTQQITQGTSPWTVSGVSHIDNLPAVYPVSQSTSPWIVSGTTNIGNLPAIQPVSGTVTANQGTNPWTISGIVDTELPAAAALADGTSNPTVPAVGAFNEVWGQAAATWSRQKAIEHGLNTSGTGLTAAGMMAEFDDTSPTTPTENQFATVRMSGKRELYNVIKDAAGNDRGVNVTAANALVVDSSAITQTVSGTVNTIQVTNPWTVSGVSHVDNFPATQPVSQSGAWNVSLLASTNSIGTTGTTSSPIQVNQKTSDVTPIQLNSSSTLPINGIIVQAISTNTASVFIGNNNVTVSNGFELQAGQAISFTCNLNTLYVVGSNNTDKVCYNVV